MRIRSCTTIVMHATAGSTVGSALVTLAKRGLSYHYLIAQRNESFEFQGRNFRLEAGSVVKCVRTSRVAFHCGVSTGPHGPFVNSYSIGIAFANMNDGVDPYSEAEWASARELVLQLKTAIPSIRFITSHRQISYPRKTDPMGFNVANLAGLTGLNYFFRNHVPEI